MKSINCGDWHLGWGFGQYMYSGRINEKDKEAWISKGDVSYNSSWRNGYITQKITVYDNSLQSFIEMTKGIKLIKAKSNE